MILAAFLAGLVTGSNPTNAVLAVVAAILFGALGAALPSLVRWANTVAERRFLDNPTFFGSHRPGYTIQGVR